MFRISSGVSHLWKKHCRESISGAGNHDWKIHEAKIGSSAGMNDPKHSSAITVLQMLEKNAAL